jgi:DNA-binding MarR family transcriptional regulator
MPARSPARFSRADAVEVVAERLLPRASLITRLLLRHAEAGLSRADMQILAGLQHDGPQRVTALAAAQALAQPTVTQLVAGLEARGLVARERDPGDGRAILVSVTGAGAAVLQDLRARYRNLLREDLADRSDEEVLALASATEILQEVIDALQRMDK